MKEALSHRFMSHMSHGFGGFDGHATPGGSGEVKLAHNKHLSTAEEGWINAGEFGR